MAKERMNRLLLIAGIGLSAAGLIFVCVWIFTGMWNRQYLAATFVYIVLSNLFHFLQGQCGWGEADANKTQGGNSR